MCDFCENRKEITLESNQGRKSHWLIIRGEEISRLYCRFGDVSNAYGIEVRYCPICGSKLNEGVGA